MNDKWFNIAMIIIFTSLVANGFVLMLTAFPGGSSYAGLHQDKLDYKTFDKNYAYTNNTGSFTATNQDTYTPITMLTGDPFGLAPLNIIVTGFIGLELLLYTLSQVFSVFAVFFYVIILIMFTVKTIVVAYFASVLIRTIFGGRQ